MAYGVKAAGRREKLKQALVSAAERMIETEGLRGIKARELAYKAGCAVGAIYNVVADLDDLIFAVNARTLAVLEVKLTEAGATAASEMPGVPGALDRLKRLALAYLNFAAANRPRWRAVFDHRPADGRAVPDWYMADQLRLFRYVEEPLAVLQPDTTADHRALLARSLFSAVHGIVILGLEEKLQLIPLPTLREQVILMVDAMGKGLARD